jgi:hypothetical protein
MRSDLGGGGARTLLTHQRIRYDLLRRDDRLVFALQEAKAHPTDVDKIIRDPTPSTLSSCEQTRKEASLQPLDACLAGKLMREEDAPRD